MKIIDISNQKYGRLSVLRFSGRRNGGYYWTCKCECGSEVDVQKSNLVSGGVKSCGCLQSEYSKKRAFIHGKSGTRTYITCVSMKQRCGDSGHTAYKRYGGMGIKVCERWMKFENFLEDMGERPEGKTIDRIDGEKGYFPGNCRWATAKEQSRNISSNVRITINGESVLMIDYAEKNGLSGSTYWRRKRNGWSEDDILKEKRHKKIGELKPNESFLSLKKVIMNNRNVDYPELNERERTILRMRLGLIDNERKTLDEVAEKIGVCRERVRQIENYSLEMLTSKYTPC